MTLVVRFRDQINLMECETAYEVKPCSFTSLNLQYAEESTVDADTKTGGSCPLRTHTTISFIPCWLETSQQHLSTSVPFIGRMKPAA